MTEEDTNSHGIGVYVFIIALIIWIICAVINHMNGVKTPCQASVNWDGEYQPC
jgi:hypothetical protein